MPLVCVLGFVPAFPEGFSIASHFSFICMGCVSTLGLAVRFHVPPPASPRHFQPAAVRLTPLSDGRVYVISFLYPSANAARLQAPYSMELAFLVPSVQVRLTSRVQPLSAKRATGLPTMATPTIESPRATPTQNFAPGTGLWWRWCSLTKALASSSVTGTIIKSLNQPSTERVQISAHARIVFSAKRYLRKIFGW